jgi:hypothetical protein
VTSLAVAPTALYLNGVDVARQFGFVLDDVGSAFDTPERSDVLLDLPQGVGALLSDLPGRVAPRALQLSGTLPASTATLLETAKDGLKAVCADGLVEIRLVSRDVIFRGRLAGISMAHSSPQLRTSNAAARVTLRFLCPDPLAWDRSPQTIGFTSTRVALLLGTGPSVGRDGWSAIITIAGAATTPILTESDAAGNALRTMSFTGWSPTASDAIEIDCGRGLVTRITAGVRSNGMADLAAGYAFPKLDPAEGDYSSSAFPGLAVSSGVGVIDYYRSWR